ncbi:L-threonylcarbamoyladenylate synthase [Sinimarinibacterium sp. NLF-5-8]|uniref:L-threonylcarbamoyladenylate synthase n=1 Tax=Sinimarinibacterium sp. NLF-5-8 TaxID=2698684 RepID=UPI00137BDCBD|nr:Sua5/YciO/YrdC/YwlC family protein [Sinimarinibacterium sp. NLF-5-8]QHS10794.1 tRNA threonylcarbamoyladenosine biosynthesis protein RimN [Sinimarinibacterium sp. NLF-5-8]
MNAPALAPWHLHKAAAAVRAGGIIACPTEAVWGISCDPLNQMACERLIALKRRDWRKGVIVVAARFEDLPSFVLRPDDIAMQRARASWPGPNTWVFPVSADAPQWITGAHPSLAVRITAHPLLRALCARCGPLVSTSANLSGRAPARTISEVRLQLGKQLDYIVPGALGGRSTPTRIRDVLSGEVLRA